MNTGFDERTGPDAGPIPNTLEVFIRTNFRTWLRVAMTILRSREDAEDAVQNAQLTMYRRWDRILNLATPDEMRALAISMVKDSAIDAARARTRETNKVSRYAVLGEVPGDQPTPLGDEVLDRSGVSSHWM
ncbi:RNA polymerase sigma factor [Kitasatospora sp. NPDC057198]|uniref:RNA polymerase sigma factor n=1 Tax=Kitasatospora sp. NPDC057198 TaxID=3346046 RepID=UPI00362BE97C